MPNVRGLIDADIDAAPAADLLDLLTPNDRPSWLVEHWLFARSRRGVRWSPKRAAYIWNVNGRQVSARRLQTELGGLRDHAQSNMRHHSQLFTDRKISLQSWQRRMGRETKQMFVTEYITGRGGLAQMTQADWGRIGAAVKGQYKYIDRFAMQVYRGEMSIAQFEARAERYAGGGWSMFNAGRTQAHMAAGFTQERRVIQPGDNCRSCLGYAAAGWVPIGDLPEPGQASECLSNCRCEKKFRRGPEPRKRPPAQPELPLVDDVPPPDLFDPISFEVGEGTRPPTADEVNRVRRAVFNARARVRDSGAKMAPLRDVVIVYDDSVGYAGVVFGKERVKINAWALTDDDALAYLSENAADIARGREIVRGPDFDFQFVPMGQVGSIEDVVLHEWGHLLKHNIGDDFYAGGEFSDMWQRLIALDAQESSGQWASLYGQEDQTEHLAEMVTAIINGWGGAPEVGKSEMWDYVRGVLGLLL